MYLPTEPDVILAQRAMAQGCAPDCWHCRAHARFAGAPFPFTAARALALVAVESRTAAGTPAASGGAGVRLALASSPSDRRSAVDGRGGDDGGAQGRRPLGSAGTVQAPPISDALGRVRGILHCLLVVGQP